MTTPQQGATPPPPPPPTPIMALRTYTALRLGSVGVIAVLAFAICREMRDAADGCRLQDSISAYYYTSVQSVFVGTLVTLGLVMIVLWGKTPFEDGFLNLAGLLAPVVAFVPTKDTNKCGIEDALGNQVDSGAEKEKVIAVGREAITNNMYAYLWVVALVLVLVLVVGVIAFVAHWESITEHPFAYWGPWLLAVILWGLGSYKFTQDKPWFYENAHEFAAKTMFGFIGLVVINIGIQKWTGNREKDRMPHKLWAFVYWGLAALMVLGLAIPSIVDNHEVFWLEAWEIGLLAVFWLLQTGDRLNEGAPPRTHEEEERMAPAQAAPDGG